MKIAIIGGTGIDESDSFTKHDIVKVVTKYGSADVVNCEFCGQNIYFVPRHGIDHAASPSQINYRAQIAAIKKLGVQQVIGVSAVGSLKKGLAPGSFAVLSDFIDLTKRRQDTFFDETTLEVVHTDMTTPYCPCISELLIEACENEKVVYEPEGIYVAVEGPRYESPAEINLYRSWGAHIVGMTNYPEVVLAKEAGLCYGAISVITNYAAGISPTPLNHNEVRAAFSSAMQSLTSILTNTMQSLSECVCCDCRSNSKLIV